MDTQPIQRIKLNGVNGINLNTAVSMSLVISIVGATWYMSGVISSAKNDFIARADKIEDRIGTLEKYKETWTDADMFRWSVHFQKENPALKIPEPENHSGR